MTKDPTPGTRHPPPATRDPTPDTRHSTLGTRHLLQTYSSGAGAFDEMQEKPGTPRAHWQALADSLEQLGRPELEARWENGRRILREHGVTYSVYGDPQAIDRPWGLDFIPLLITAEEWARLEAGLVQRSRLLNLILADIYTGSQRLLRDGFLPPELVYANPGFLRACRGIAVPAKTYLHFLACDLARSADGQWWVLADRAQAPGGAGYAWENRTVVSRVLPEQIRHQPVQPLAGFFQRQREMLFEMAPAAGPHRGIVLLTPGPASETYFEHAFMARSLGFPLVEGADLTVRERGVFLKTIEGLQPVDVILRRVDDAFCDPLELRGDSAIGVSGLIEAARAGRVTVVNALGAGLVESPAFMAFLPGLCRHLLGEDLLLPSVATWWCGQANELRYAIEHLDSLDLKPAFDGQPPLELPEAPVAAGRRKVAEHRKRIADIIRASPRDFVAQERVKPSRAPAWTEGRLSARQVILRAYVASAGQNVTVMPGGLARFAKALNSPGRLTQDGAMSKDTWVVGGAPANAPETAPAALESAPGEHAFSGTPSRAADHLFWLGRYTERLEQLLRLLRCVLGRVSGEPRAELQGQQQGLQELVGHLGLLPGGADVQLANGVLTARMLELLYTPDAPGGAPDLLKRIRSISSAVRDRFSGDTWRILGRLDADARTRPRRLPLAGATALSHNLVLDLAAFNGMEMENMTRGRGWRFLDFGRRLERGLSVLKLSRAALSVAAQPAAGLEPLLEIADSLMTYRRRHFASPQLAQVLELVLRDESNPRSLAFQCNLLAEHIAALGSEPGGPSHSAEQARVQTLVAAVRSADLPALALQHTPGTGDALPLLLDVWAADLASLSDEVTNHYFSHSAAR